MSENRSTSPPKGRVGSQSVFGTKASLVANTVRARIGGRFAALHIPQSEAEKLERVAKDATEQRKLRALPEAGLSLEYAYGFNGRRCQNLYDLGQLSYCYSVAALGVVWDDEKKEQRIFSGTYSRDHGNGMLQSVTADRDGAEDGTGGNDREHPTVVCGGTSSSEHAATNLGAQSGHLLYRLLGRWAMAAVCSS